MTPDTHNGNKPTTVAALFVRADSVYKTMPGVDCYDIERDARTWAGGVPVVAHPPCRAWASLRHCAKPRDGEKDLAHLAIDRVRLFGGVLEHPQLSTLWKVAGLPEPGSKDEFGGWTLIVDQNWWGHRARKRTRLYICGVDALDLPSMPMKLGHATHTVGLWSGRDKATCRPTISKPEYEGTPPQFARWLVELASRTHKPTCSHGVRWDRRCWRCERDRDERWLEPCFFTLAGEADRKAMYDESRVAPIPKRD